MGLGCQPCEYYQSTAPSSPLDKALWIDTSTGPPWQLKVYHLASATWENVGITTGGTPAGGSALFLLASTTLSAAAASIVLTPAASIATHLMVRFQLRGTDSAALQDVLCRLNADTAGNYDYTLENVTNVVGSSQVAAATAWHIGLLTCAGTAAGRASAGQLDLFYYQSTAFLKQCQSRVTSSVGTGSSQQREDRAAGTWRSTAAVSSVTLLAAAGNLDTGSTASLYGLA